MAKSSGFRGLCMSLGDGRHCSLNASMADGGGPLPWFNEYWGELRGWMSRHGRSECDNEVYEC